jgi:hypothetical protein
MWLPTDTIQAQNTLKSIRVRVKRGKRVDRGMDASRGRNQRGGRMNIKKN